jgi:hypothetical protein
MDGVDGEIGRRWNQGKKEKEKKKARNTFIALAAGGRNASSCIENYSGAMP